MCLSTPSPNFRCFARNRACIVFFPLIQETMDTFGGFAFCNLWAGLDSPIHSSSTVDIGLSVCWLLLLLFTLSVLVSNKFAGVCGRGSIQLLDLGSPHTAVGKFLGTYLIPELAFYV